MQVMTDTRERLIDRVFISGANALSYAFLPLPQQEEEAKADRYQTERALMDTQKWRDVWEETRAAMKQLEQSMEVVGDLERAVLVEQHANICSEGVTKTLELMRDGVLQVRTRFHAADIQLTAAVEKLIADSTLTGMKIRPNN